MPPPYSILYVDDDTDLLDLGKSFLESTQEFTVETSDSAKKAHALLRQHRPDAIVSDYEMPDMDGILFLKHVRAEYGDLPFIIFTGRGREEVVIDALNNGADFYLQKGSEPEAVYAELRHVLRRAIQMRQAQLTLAEQEQRFHDLQNATDLIQSVAPDGRFLFVNKKWQDTLGYGKEDLATITLFDIIHDDSRGHCMEVFPRVLAGEDVGIIDVTFRAKDGRKVYAEGFASCRIIDGKPQYTRGIFKDVTDRRKTEVALKESEEKFRTLVEYTLDGILILDPQGLILFANLAAGKLIEMENYHDVIGTRNVMEFIAPESRENVLQDFSRVAQGIDGFLAQYRIITSLRRALWVESVGKSITFEGKPAILISLRNITDRKQAESFMRENEEKFRTIFENSPYPIAINSMPDQKFIAINPAFLKVSGYSENEVLGKNPVELGLLSIPEAAKLVSRAVLAGKIENVPLALTANAGRRIHVLFSTIPITIGGRSASLTVTVEVTKLKRIEEELLKKNEDLSSAYEELSSTEEELRENYEQLHERERALKENEEKYRLLTETTPDVIYLMDKNGTITHISPQITRYGYTPEDVLSRNFAEFLDKDDIPRAMADMAKTLATGQSTVIPVKMHDKAGNIIWMEDNGAAVRDASGTIVGISGILRDITARKTTEDALRESEEKFRALVENSLEGIFITDFTGLLLFANQAAGKIVDFADYRDLIGKKNVMEFVAPESQAEVIKDLGQVAQGIDAYLVHYKLITETKREIWVECIGKKILFSGAPAMLVSMRDVTERRNAEEVLRESENKLATIFRSSPVALTLVSATDGRFVDVNDAFVANTGFSREEVIGRTASEIGIFADSGDYERMSSTIRSQRGIQGMEIRCRSKDGSVQTCRFTSTIVIMNKKPHVLSNVENITEQKEAEAALSTIVRSMVGATGLESLDKITENMALWLGADCVMVSELSADKSTLSALSMVLDGKKVPSFTCSLPGTPCGSVAVQGFTVIEERLGEIFPTCRTVAEMHFQAYIGAPLFDSSGQTMGILSAFFRKPIQTNPAHREIMEILSVKAAAEIERSRIEQTLKESEEKFRTLVENSLDGIIIADPTGRILFANQAAARMVASVRGTEQGSIGERGRNVQEFIAPEAREALMQDLRSVAEGMDKGPVIYPALTATGNRIWAEGVGKRILYRNAPAILISVRDISARKQMEEALLRTNKQLNLLSSITRHDVLNKIAVIQGNIALAQKRGKEQDFAALVEKIGPIITVIREQVEFTRVYQNLGAKEPEWQKPGGFLTQSHIPKSIHLSNELGGLEIFADLMLEKVFANLLDNTLRHAEHATEIRLDSYPDPEGLTITYEDNGIGIPADEKEKIFDRGYGKNTGLGLFLAREILAITGMTIRETGEEGKGARFEIHVPAGAYRLVKK